MLIQSYGPYERSSPRAVVSECFEILKNSMIANFITPSVRNVTENCFYSVFFYRLFDSKSRSTSTNTKLGNSQMFPRVSLDSTYFLSAGLPEFFASPVDRSERTVPSHTRIQTENASASSTGVSTQRSRRLWRRRLASESLFLAFR